jgi:DNA primase
VAGRILPEDIEEVRRRARIDDVVSATVTLRRSGAGSLQGLCPFHEEKTPSFQVTPARGLFYCFGCGQGGDVITFVRQLNNLSFSEAVELLAAKYGVQLRYEEADRPQAPPGARVRLLAANAAAAAFFSQALNSAEAAPGRDFLVRRGFDRQAAERFGVGFAPRDGRALTRHLKSLGHSEDELLAAGLTRRGGWDYFQSRLIWPIRDAGQAVLGFGARRLFEDDRLPAKYINTPETLAYHKSQVLYGLDLARRHIGQQYRAVIVEGYTDVMACHLAGVEVAVASCGTAFGDDHARLIQRLMGGDAFHGEVVFTFDGDAAGQKAALKVFSGDARFAAQTYVAVEPGGLDPCDLRLAQGDAALRELIARREPLYRFVMRNVIGQFDLDRVDGRVAAARQAAGLITSIRDHSLIDGYIRELAAMVGMEVEEVRRVVGQAVRRPPRNQTGSRGSQTGRPTSDRPGYGNTSDRPGYDRNPSDRPGYGNTSDRPGLDRTTSDRPGADRPADPMIPGMADPGPSDGPDPDNAGGRIGSVPLPRPDDRDLGVEHDILKLMLQHPEAFTIQPPWNGVTAEDFLHPAHAAVFAAIVAQPDNMTPGWAQSVLKSLPADGLREWSVQLAVEPIPMAVEPLSPDSAGPPVAEIAAQANETATRLQLLTLQRRLAALRSTLQRVNPLSDQSRYDALFSSLLPLQAAERSLNESLQRIQGNL